MTHISKISTIIYLKVIQILYLSSPISLLKWSIYSSKTYIVIKLMDNWVLLEMSRLIIYIRKNDIIFQSQTTSPIKFCFAATNPPCTRKQSRIHYHLFTQKGYHISVILQHTIRFQVILVHNTNLKNKPTNPIVLQPRHQIQQNKIITKIKNHEVNTIQRPDYKSPSSVIPNKNPNP